MTTHVSEVHVAAIFRARNTFETQVSKGMTMCRSKRLEPLAQRHGVTSQQSSATHPENHKPRKEYTLLLLQKKKNVRISTKGDMGTFCSV